MTFMPQEIPDPSVALDESATWANDVPFVVKQTTITHARHRWFQVIAMGTQTAQFTKTPGINGGATQRIQFEHKPDYISVSVSGQTANTGRCVVFRGEPGGDGILLGPNGALTIPASENGILTIVNVGTTATYGAVIAHAGFDARIDYIAGL